MRDDLVDIQELMKLLGYSDERSVRKWCKARGIPVLLMGLKKYVISHYLTQYIDNQLFIFDKGKEYGYLSSDSLHKKPQHKTKEKYNPDNEIISKYLTKYETNDKSKTAK